MTANQNPTRVLRRSFLLGASSLPLLGALGCKKESTPAATQGTCSDVTGLPPGEIKLRDQLEYVDRTPFAGKVCVSCQHYTAPKPGETCGGCKVVPGKIHPAGYCKLYTPRI